MSSFKNLYLGKRIFIAFDSSEHIKVSFPHHTIHTYHTKKVPEYKIEKVEVEKIIKIPVPIKEIVKIPVPYIVQQKVHTVPVHKYVHSSEHVHHKPTTKHVETHDNYGKSYEAHESQSHFAAEPLVEYESLKPSQAYDFRPYDFTSGLHTMVYGDHGGHGYEVKEQGADYASHEPIIYDTKSHSYLKQEPSIKREYKALAYPYPLPQEHNSHLMDFEYGFSPNHGQY